MWEGERVALNVFRVVLMLEMQILWVLFLGLLRERGGITFNVFRVRAIPEYFHKSRILVH